MMVFWLLVGHVLADYPLQGDFLAKAKNRHAPVPGIPWWQAMGAHAIIHGSAVALVTGSVVLGLAEALMHFVIDDIKCQGGFSYNQDQAFHLLCKLGWWYVAVTYPGVLP